MKIVILLLLSLSLYSQSCPSSSYIPKNALKYMPTVYKEAIAIVPHEVDSTYFSSLIELESCVRLCGDNYYARRCWNPASELKTKREQGVGFGQITRAWKSDGRLRFDTLENLRKKYPKELHKLTWGNIKEQPELQITAIMLLWKDNYRLLTNDITTENKIAFSDSMYNGGYKYLNRERKKCKLLKNCDSTVWFNNVALIKSGRAKRKLYGNRTAWDINRHHVNSILKIRWRKYKLSFKEEMKNNNFIYQKYDDGSIMRFYGE